MSYADAVQRGIAKLDEHVPDWRGRIRLDYLDMGDPESCIVGQVFKHEGGFNAGLSKLGIINAENFGFEINHDITEEVYEGITMDNYRDLQFYWDEELDACNCVMCRDDEEDE